MTRPHLIAVSDEDGNSLIPAGALAVPAPPSARPRWIVLEDSGAHFIAMLDGVEYRMITIPRRMCGPFGGADSGDNP